MKRMFVALLVVLGVLATATVGQAAQLTLTGGRLGTFGATQPCPGTATAVPSAAGGAGFTAVSLTLPSALCSGATLRLAVRNGTTRIAQGQAVVTGSTATVTGLSYAAASTYTVSATVDGWGLPTTWSYTPPPATSGPITAGNANTVLTPPTYPTNTLGNRICAQIEVRPVDVRWPWSLRIDLNQRPFNGVSANLLERPGWLKIVSDVGGVVVLEGNGANATRAESFTICANTPPPTYDPALTYTVTQAAAVVESPGVGCTTTVVRVSGTPTFYAGWRADVDMNAAIAIAATQPNTFSGVYAANDSFTLQDLGGGVYRVSGGNYNNWGIRDGDAITVRLCAS